jgi:hypothetical protein
MSTEPLSDTIQPLTLTDTVYTWYNTTNEIINLVNPLNIYDVIPENGITSSRSGISDGILTFSVNLKSDGGLNFEGGGSISLSTANILKESFSTSSSYKFFAEDSSGTIKAVTFDLNEGKGIDFIDNTNSLTIGIDSSVVTLTDTQTLTNKSFVAPKIVNDISPSGSITLLAPAGIGSYNLTLPSNFGGAGQYLKSLGNGTLAWDTPSGGTGGGILNIIAESGTTFVNLSTQNLSFQGDTGINTTASVVGGTPRVVIGIDNTVVTLAKTQTLKEKTLEEPKIKNISAQYTITLKPSIAQESNYTLTLPTTDGDSGQYLKTDGSGVLSWDTPSGGGVTSFTIKSDSQTATFNASSEALQFVGGIGLNTSLSLSGSDRKVTIDLDTSGSTFTDGNNLTVSFPGGNTVRYSLDTVVTDITLSNSLFTNINYLYSDITGNTGPLYTLMDSDWDETQTEDGHIVGQLVLVPFAN